MFEVLDLIEEAPMTSSSAKPKDRALHALDDGSPLDILIQHESMSRAVKMWKWRFKELFNRNCIREARSNHSAQGFPQALYKIATSKRYDAPELQKIECIWAIGMLADCSSWVVNRTRLLVPWIYAILGVYIHESDGGTYDASDDEDIKLYPCVDGLFAILMIGGWGPYFATVKEHTFLTACASELLCRNYQKLIKDAHNILQYGRGKGSGLARQRLRELALHHYKEGIHQCILYVPSYGDASLNIDDDATPVNPNMYFKR